MNCGSHPELASPAYMRQVAARMRRERIPVSGAFDITYRCNLRCAHCYAGHKVADPASRAAERGTEEIVGLLSAATEAGCLWLVLSGGEPLLREDFLQIYTVARRLGMIVTVFTNATLVRQTHLEVFGEYPPDSVEVSIYGASEATYERITGVAGSYRLAQLGIERLLDGGVRVNLKTMILRDNVHEIPAMEAFAREFGLRFRMDPLIAPRLDGDPAPLSQRVGAAEAVTVELSTEERWIDLARFLEQREDPAAEEIMSPSRTYRCGAGTASFHLDPDGFLHPCVMSPMIAQDAFTMGFQKAWKAVVAAVDRVECDGSAVCATCRAIFLCGYCPGLFALEGASPARPPEYVCSLGKERLRTIGTRDWEVAGVGAN